MRDSYNQAERRILALEKHLQRSPEYKILYSNFLKEYLNLSHRTHVDSCESPCYLMPHRPHHGVFRELSITTKLRVWYVGVLLLATSWPSYIGWSHCNSSCADVEKMYRQRLEDESQRSLQMILWRDHPSKPLGIFKLNNVTYGTASEPFLSVRCLK